MVWRWWSQKQSGRVVHKWEHYLPVYERHFSRFQHSDAVFWEIGCGEGGSLEMWRAFLGPHARIVGLDIRPECRAFECRGTAVRIGDQADTDFLDAVLGEFGQPDVVLDDGSHQQPDINKTFDHVYPRMARTGVYAVEDLHVAYWRKMGGGQDNPASFVERTKRLIDDLNSINPGSKLLATEFGRSTLSMHVYPGIVVFERGRALPPLSQKRGHKAP